MDPKVVLALAGLLCSGCAFGYRVGVAPGIDTAGRPTLTAFVAGKIGVDYERHRTLDLGVEVGSGGQLGSASTPITTVAGGIEQTGWKGGRLLRRFSIRGVGVIEHDTGTARGGAGAGIDLGGLLYRRGGDDAREGYRGLFVGFHVYGVRGEDEGGAAYFLFPIAFEDVIRPWQRGLYREPGPSQAPPPPPPPQLVPPPVTPAPGSAPAQPFAPSNTPADPW